MSERDAREAVAAARTLVAEWAEEGVETWERVEAAPDRSARPAEPMPPAMEPAPRAAEALPRATQPTPRAADPGRPTLAEVREVLGECTRCRLHEGRTQIVFGDGNPEADLMFVGEGPGEQEDLRGIPFCGRAGELLTSMIEKGLEIPRSSVYICNIVKCRPPGNRNPLPDEVGACRAFLDGQIEAIAPKVIVTLGKPAATTLLGREVAITKLRGNWQEYKGIPLMPTLHPAYLLRQYTAENRRNVWSDLKAALERARG